MEPLLSFYGDDFTGSSAVMEVLSFAGVPTLLFLDRPDPRILEQRPDLKAIGIASVARSKDPAWMRNNLPSAFEALAEFRAPVVHYKVCSTFDSAPEVGSIGTAADIGAGIFKSGWIPLVVGAPAIGRYQAFGQLFAAVGGTVHRLDRHPVMATHPVTPMDEADLGRHLARQTDKRVGVVDLAAVKAGRADEALTHCLGEGAQIVALDVVDQETLAEAGRLIWQDRDGPVFTIGSQGVEYALVAHWRETGLVEKPYALPSLEQVDQIFAVNGSCSPITAAQIEAAETSGFAILDFDPLQALSERTAMREVERCLTDSLSILAEGRDVLVTTARGPDDATVPQLAEAIRKTGSPAGEVNTRLGEALGRLVARVHALSELPRMAIGGGDTSGHALRAIGAEALSIVAPLSPGAPLCRIHAKGQAPIDGLEVTLKGGQMGDRDFFIRAKGGSAT
jgi:uncharacterized protein YgbK (DUF1537 family)